ncbi:hypothetical protein [Staphylococcus kloosii]|jgi:hypothetical protein|uniref:hypothetical protein n=1 Tax=Staphylococcus kloosii TaxID=29384 RepID=UPI00189D199A|nr:hypothetical protein [Staphylococcus kloosii]MBF7022515.1 hypothetical protein [Staphylococcus kloosii]
MTMTNKEAATIISLIDTAFNMNFTKDEFKARLWVEQLTTYGDYDKTLYKTKKYIREHKYKPTLSEIVDSKPKQTDDIIIPKEETHEYRMQHDPNYRKNREQLKKQWEQKKKEWLDIDD